MEIRALGSVRKLMVNKKAEGDCCTPQRCMTHICYWHHTLRAQRYTHTQGLASLFSCPIFSETLWGNCGLRQRGIKNNILENNAPGLSVSGQACHSTIILISCCNQSVYMCLCVCVREPLILPVYIELFSSS